ncbi:nucleoside 2-deoxyribosyltransferase [Kutzneria chonburiensis]|jgi:nucleoside 2-deoxyribosyltransferase|uniref:Nucleoside 2-deoxyribosyltransferase n=1 Tax=Kutzneria chonburiensis TaxID=1483604 RepID=A0ABV6MSZ1_9PSEU|nr:nucleoside 2-deoxyribosyltransferase [Kutzneria chonburiensis]
MTTTQRVTPSSVFVGGPFYGLVNPETGVMAPRDQSKINRIIEHFEQGGAKVYNAHRREQWGAQFLTAPVCTKLDYTEIAQSDVFVAYPGVPVSPGTHVEVGWASALGKPMVLLLERDAKHTFLVIGLETVANVEFIYFDEVDEILEQLDDAVHKVLTRTGPVRTDI